MNLTLQKRIRFFVFSLVIAGVIPVFSMTTPNVTVVPDSTNTYSEYTITSATGNGASASIRANVDSLYIRFNGYTTVPASINSAYILVNNTSSNGVNVRDSVVAILSPVNIPRNGSFTIIVRIGANIKNPSAAGDYYLYMMSNRGPDANAWVQSSPYSIAVSNSNVSKAAVTPDPSVAGEQAKYTIGFNLGLAGALTAGESTILLAFPPLTGVPNGTINGVTVNGTSASASALNDTVYITTPVNIDNYGSVSLVFSSGAGIVNPSVDSSYTLGVSTSSEPNFITSDPYSISPAGQLSITAISTKPDTVNEGGAFSFNFRTGSSGALTANNDTVFVIFPQNTYMPLNMSSNNVSLSSGGFSSNAASITVFKANPSDDDTVAIVTPINISSSADVTLEFIEAAGYLNPSIAGNYTLGLKTSQDQTVVQSNPYAVVNTVSQISQALVTPTSNSTSAATSYTINFNLGHLGRLVPGLSTITLEFNSNYALSTDSADYSTSTITVAEGSPVSIPWSNIAVNAVSDIIQITIPETVEPLNSDNIVIFLSGETAQPITNPATDGNYTMFIKTSVEATSVPSAEYNIGGTAITINSVTLSDYGVNQNAQYTFNITTSVALQDRTGQDPDDYIKIIFPEGTVLPSTIAISNVQLNGNAAQIVTVNTTNRTVTATVDVNIDPGTFNVVIQTGAGLDNPIVPSTSFYKVTMSTSQELVQVTSLPYEITGNNTQSGPVTMSVNPSVINATDAVYSLSFTTSSSGKIAGGRPAGSSAITVNFDDATIVPASISPSTVLINDIPLQNLTVDSSGAGGVVTLQMPNGLTINNSSTASILFTTDAGL
ncbi:MAG: hypothetical protein JXR46_16935, partial [Calditrichaceae bacterium]|nr:hypothetical protein [Calditrichaceae bacterium]